MDGNKFYQNKKINLKGLTLYLVLVYLIFLSCNNINVKRSYNMEFIPKKFSHVPTDSDLRNRCSPDEPDFDWYGILINGPQTVIINRDDEKKFIPICGFYQIETRNLVDSDPMKINVIQDENEQLFSGFIVKRTPHPIKPNPNIPKINPEDVQDQISLGYFNPNLLNYVDFPLFDGFYEVFVEYGGMKSNTITIEIQIK
jgi:hypothetical protein